MEHLAKEGKINMKKVNVDYDASLSQQYNIKSVPTMVLTDLGGTEIKRSTGQMSEVQIMEFYNG